MEELQKAIRETIRDNPTLAYFRMHPAQEVMIENTQLVQINSVLKAFDDDNGDYTLTMGRTRQCGGVSIVLDIRVSPYFVYAEDKSGKILREIPGVPVPKSMIKV